MTEVDVAPITVSSGFLTCEHNVGNDGFSCIWLILCVSDRKSSLEMSKQKKVNIFQAFKIRKQTWKE